MRQTGTLFHRKLCHALNIKINFREEIYTNVNFDLMRRQINSRFRYIGILGSPFLCSIFFFFTTSSKYFCSPKKIIRVYTRKMWVKKKKAKESVKLKISLGRRKGGWTLKPIVIIDLLSQKQKETPGKKEKELKKLRKKKHSY